MRRPALGQARLLCEIPRFPFQLDAASVPQGPPECVAWQAMATARPDTPARKDESWTLRLADFQELIGANAIERLLGAGRPENFNRGFFGGTQTEVKPLVIGRDIAAGRSCETNLTVHADARAVSIAIAACASQHDRKPMAAAAAVEEQHGRTAESCQNNIHKPIVIDVTECCAACSNRSRRAGIGAFEMAAMIQREQRQFLISQRSIDLLNVIEDVALRHEKIFPAVVV